MTTLGTLLDALDASPTTLTRDHHRGLGRVGDYAIRGRYGHGYPNGDGFLLCVTTDESPRRWTNVKQRLSFCHVTQDGDDEGCLHLDHLPTPHEAEAIREAIGIRKRRHLTPDALAKARSAAERARSWLNRPLAA
jgi:hypothetical protein